MFRFLYSLFGYSAIAPIMLYLKKRGKKNPAYLDNWHERFGIKLINQSDKPIIWLHAVSVGETYAMRKLVELIHQNLPQYQILITNMTPTGRSVAQRLFPYAHIHYIPYDFPFAVKNFYKTFKPKIAIIMETEIWPNLIHYAAVYSVPICLVNARLSSKSYNGYNRFKWLVTPILNKIDSILCQDQNTSDNFTKLGYKKELTIIGSTKFDFVIDKGLAKQVEHFINLFGKRKIICFASTRDGEEQMILDNLNFTAELLYLIIPRHPERFSIVEDLLKDKHLKYQKRSENQVILPETKVVIGDSMGEMLAYYAISYLAVIGGSFGEYGGQNPIEAIYMEVPVIFGASMYNFNQIAKDSLAHGCAKQIESVQELKVVIEQLVENDVLYNQYQHNCQSFIKDYQGASRKAFEVICKKLS